VTYLKLCLIWSKWDFLQHLLLPLLNIVCYKEESCHRIGNSNSVSGGFQKHLPILILSSFLFILEVMLVELACCNEGLFPISIQMLIQTSAFMENKC